MIDMILDKRGPLYPENTEKVKAASNSAVDPLFLQASVLPSEICH